MIGSAGGRSTQVFYEPDLCTLEDVQCPGEPLIIYAYVTAYNTTTTQTDSTPCLSASGVDICGVDNVVACPRDIPFGTEVDIAGSRYVCLDRMAPRFNDRYDISFKEDVEGAREFGLQQLKITIWK